MISHVSPQNIVEAREHGRKTLSRENISFHKQSSPQDFHNLLSFSFVNAGFSGARIYQ
jgi:hypothetical protein